MKEYEENEKEEDEDSSESEPGRGSRERAPAVPNKQMSPFDLRFSQMRARSQFRDGRLVETAIDQIQPVRHKSAKVSTDAEGAGDGQGTAGTGELEEVWRLEAPFPPIEVLHWRCKLRDEQTGRPRIDPKTGGECYDEHRWFTLDNRRLYCLQKVAASLHPARAIIDVVELPPGSLTRQRQIKKFRTLDSGRSIVIGGRDGGVDQRTRWSWREATGTEAEESEPDVDNCHVQMRRRPRKGSRSGLLPRRQQPNGCCGAADGASWAGSASSHSISLGGMLVFIVIYAALRLSVNTLSAAYKQWR